MCFIIKIKITMYMHWKSRCVTLPIAIATLMYRF